jgi:catechol-2,3-dioxygenase
MHPQSRLGHVALRVRSLAVSVPFYTAVLGLREVARLDALERVMVGDDLETLRALYARLRDQRVAMTRGLDHEVSQSLYLRDPDGLMIEVYVDADPAWWAARAEAMATVRPLRVDWLE